MAVPSKTTLNPPEFQAALDAWASHVKPDAALDAWAIHVKQLRRAETRRARRFAEYGSWSVASVRTDNWFFQWEYYLKQEAKRYGYDRTARPNY